jgi:hypothetical protein
MASAQPRRIERLLTIEALGALTEAEERTTHRLRDALTAYAALPGKQLRVFPDVATAVRARLRAGTGDSARRPRRCWSNAACVRSTAVSSGAAIRA